MEVEDVTPRSLPCPACRGPMGQLSAAGLTVDRCTRCAGMWFDQGELVRIARSSPEMGRLYPRWDESRLAGSSTPTGLRCPRCDLALDSYSLGGGAGLSVDACSGCGGIWLDQGDLAMHRARKKRERDPEEHPRETSERESRRSHEKQARDLEGPTSWGDWCFQFFLGLPVEFNVAPRRPAVATWLLVLANVVCFLLIAQLSVADQRGVLTRFGAVPARITALRDLWTLATSLFLHGGLGHLIGNMYFLYILGDNVEDDLGSWRFLGFYAICGLAAGLGEALAESTSALPVVGASGAVSGVMGAYLVLYPRARLTFMFFGLFQRKMSVVVYIGLWVVLQAFWAWAGVPGTAWYAHLVGFFVGLVLSRAFRGEGESSGHTDRASRRAIRG